MKGWRAALLRRTWGYWWMKAAHEPAMCIHNPDQLYPQQCGQQGEGKDSAPLFCSGKTPPGVLHPALEPSAQERHGPVGAWPEEPTMMI